MFVYQSELFFPCKQYRVTFSINIFEHSKAQEFFYISVCSEMSHTLRDSLRPLHLLSKFFGLTLFSIDPVTFKAYFSKLDAALIVINLFYVLVLNFFYWKNYFSMKIFHSEIVKSFFPIIVYINFVIYSLAKVWNFINRHKLGKYMELMAVIDKELNDLDHQSDYNKQKVFVWKFSTTQLSFALIWLVSYLKNSTN